VLAAAALSMAQVGEGAAQDLQSFAVIAGQSLTNTGPTTINGNIAVSPGTSYTGSASVTQTGDAFIGDAVAVRVQDDLTTLYNALAGRPTSPGGNLTGQDLGGMTLSPGVYNFDTSALISAGKTLTLDGGGDPNAVFIFNIGSTLTAGSGANVLLQNGAQGGNVFYRIGSSATLDTSADLVGQIVALTSATMNTSATLGCGAVYARNGSVTLDTNTIGICTLAAPDLDDAIDESLLTEAERAIAETLSDYVADGGVLPIGIAILAATQTPEELAASLAQISGEVSTGIAPMQTQSMDAFLDVVTRSGRNRRVQVARPPRDEGVPAGLVVRDEVATGGKYGKYGSDEPTRAAQPLAYSTPLVPQLRPWDAWVSGYGSHSVTDGNASIGQHKRTSDNSGFAAGLNFWPNNNLDFGIAVSVNEADFALSNGFGSGTSDTVFVAFRGRASSERAYVEGTLAYGDSDITTDRTVTIAGTDRLIGETTGNTTAAHVEAGYHMGIFTPFAGLRAQSTTISAYSEKAVSGSSSYALRFEKHTTTSLRSELGVEMQWSTARDERGTAAFGFRAAWAHEFASNEPSDRSLLTTPGVTFPVSGATVDRDSLLLAANAEWTASNGVYIDGAINAEYSGTSQDAGGSLTVGYRW